MEKATLNAELRKTTGRKTNALRAENNLPAVVYGLGKEPINITIGRSDFDRLYKQAGESTVIELVIGSDAEQVLIQDVQFDPVTDFTTHADFLRVDMNIEVEASIDIILEGESNAVKALGGTLVQNLEQLDVKALPSSLVREISVDISSLATFDDVIHVSDLNIPAGIEVLEDAEVVVATVQPPRDESELEELDAPVDTDVEKVEVTTEKKEEAEESAE